MSGSQKEKEDDYRQDCFWFQITPPSRIEDFLLNAGLYESLLPNAVITFVSVLINWSIVGGLFFLAYLLLLLIGFLQGIDSSVAPQLTVVRCPCDTRGGPAILL